MENKRILEIIRILLQQRNYITIREIAELLNVSNKTIRNDLALAEHYLAEYHLSFRKKTGTGIRIEGTESGKLSLLESVSQKILLPGGFSPTARKIYIGLRLIACTETAGSTSWLPNSLSAAPQSTRISPHSPSVFKDCQIRIVRKNNNGIFLEGKERHLRDLMFDLMTEDRGYSEFLRIVQDPSCSCIGAFPFEALDYTDRDICRFVRLVIESGGLYVNRLPFNALITVLLRVFISLIRILDDYPIRLSADFMSELANEPLYPEARLLTQALEQEYQMTFSEEELRYLQTHLLALQNKHLAPDSEKTAARKLTDELLAEWERLLNLPFTKDQVLREALTAHLAPAITRIRHGIPLENPMMDTIQAHYSNTFQIVKKSLHTLKQSDLGQMNEDEAGYLAIHLAAALDRAKKPLKTVLVCHGGGGASALLLQKLSTQIPEITVIAQESFLTIQHADLSQAELIISTLELNLSTDIPVLQVNVLMYDHDIRRLKEIAQAYYKKKNTPAVSGNVKELPQ